MTTNETREMQPREKEVLLTEDARTGPVFRPDVDILEERDAFVIHADLPGASEETVEIQLEKGVLTLHARVAEPSADSAGGGATGTQASPRTRYAEYREGSYFREFRLSESIDATGVSARMKDGVLELRLPKTADKKPRRIEVRAA